MQRKSGKGGDYSNSVTLSHSGSLSLPWNQNIEKALKGSSPLHLRAAYSPESGPAKMNSAKTRRTGGRKSPKFTRRSRRFGAALTDGVSCAFSKNVLPILEVSIRCQNTVNSL